MAQNRDSLLQYIQRFCQAFDDGPLEKVLELFSEDGVYVDFSGKRYKGKAAIEKAFTPFFRGDFGKARFHISEFIIDEVCSKVTLRWICLHEMEGLKAIPLIPRLKRFLYRMLYGKRFGWEGIDIFHFSEGLVKLKATYIFAKIPISLPNPLLPVPPREFAVDVSKNSKIFQSSLEGYRQDSR